MVDSEPDVGFVQPHEHDHHHDADNGDVRACGWSDANRHRDDDGAVDEHRDHDGADHDDVGRDQHVGEYVDQHEHEYKHRHGLAAREQPAGAADPSDSADPAAGRLATARSAFAHDAVVVLGLGGDPAAPGGAITVALCGHWEHEPPCPLAPHHTDAERGADDTVRLRVLFAVERGREDEVRSLIGRALASGQQAGPDGRVTTWTLRSSCAGAVRPDEQDYAGRLAEH